MCERTEIIRTERRAIWMSGLQVIDRLWLAISRWLMSWEQQRQTHATPNRANP
jgi:hypothetical protein